MPLHTWVTDLIVKPKVEGLVCVVVCVCIFSKWVEPGFIPDRESATITRWCRANITCCHGIPAYVHTDYGGEFRGMFTKYFLRLVMQLMLTLPCNPRANGLVERTNGVISNGLQKILTAIPQASAEKLLAEVLSELRMVPTRLGWQPYLLIFK